MSLVTHLRDNTVLLFRLQTVHIHRKFWQTAFPHTHGCQASSPLYKSGNNYDRESPGIFYEIFYPHPKISLKKSCIKVGLWIDHISIRSLQSGWEWYLKTTVCIIKNRKATKVSYTSSNIIPDLLNCKKQSRQMHFYYFKNFFGVNR